MREKFVRDLKSAWPLWCIECEIDQDKETKYWEDKFFPCKTCQNTRRDHIPWTELGVDQRLNADTNN